MAAETRHPFQVSPDELGEDLAPFVDDIFRSLKSEFMIMPRGAGFIDYPTFDDSYEVLKRETSGFTLLEPERVFRAVVQSPVSLIVLRTMLGLTPPEWAYIASRDSGTKVSEGFVRGLDRAARLNPTRIVRLSSPSRARLDALVGSACRLLSSPLPEVGDEQIHRLDKVDTQLGSSGLATTAQMGVPYAMLLYERFLGRPFAGHRDSVSELVGDMLESGIEEVLTKAGISHRKTKRAERVVGFDQAPDFLVPDEHNPKIVIEAKVCEDGGTARDKITRVQHLAELSIRDSATGKRKYEVVACIGGRGFTLRREDIRKLLIATRGKVFTPMTLDMMIAHTLLGDFQTRNL